MQIETITRALRERCPSFSGRVSAIPAFKTPPANTTETAQPLPLAHVVLLEEKADTDTGRARTQNAVRQSLTESFAVVVALKMGDVEVEEAEAGAEAMNGIHSLRAELWAALLGWRISEAHEGIVYTGASLRFSDAETLWYEFRFSTVMEIGPEDGWQERALSSLPAFTGVRFRTDCIDPADPNQTLSGTAQGPDGRIEMHFESTTG